MERAALSLIAHARHPVAAPLSEATVESLLSLPGLPGEPRAVDLGCGTGEWLRRLVGRAGGSADGVDVSPAAIARAGSLAAAAGLEDRLRFHVSDAGTFANRSGGGYDIALCIGSTHALDGLDGAGRVLRGLLLPTGVALLGEGFWEQEPSTAALAGLGGARREDLPDLAGLELRTRDAGFEVIGRTIATPAEWDDYEDSWSGSLEEWAAEHTGTPEADEALAAAHAHRAGYREGYRGTLGFAVLTLRSRS